LTRNQARAYAQAAGVRETGTALGGKSTGDENMATLREAVSQLDTAIQHLEQALDASADSNDPATAQMRASLDEANSRNEELNAVADQVALHLDRAVARVTAILES
jgi:ABC-type transporter Mla subunit MlaD